MCTTCPPVCSLLSVRLLSRTPTTAQPTASNLYTTLRGHMADAAWGSWNSLLIRRRIIITICPSAHTLQLPPFNQRTSVRALGRLIWDLMLRRTLHKQRQGTKSPDRKVADKTISSFPTDNNKTTRPF
ncbi:hypothetical protein KC345_g226 [Hortaea werneckii]|nr:hypothetical protein KC345_g226 [Hortaea werneckii]